MGRSTILMVDFIGWYYRVEAVRVDAIITRVQSLCVYSTLIPCFNLRIFTKLVYIHILSLRLSILRFILDKKNTIISLIAIT